MVNDDAKSQTRMKGDIAYEQAMRASADLLHRIREAGRESDAAREVMADVWSQSQNIPFMTTVYQAVQEAKTGPSIARAARIIPVFKLNGGGGR